MNWKECREFVYSRIGWKPTCIVFLALSLVETTLGLENLRLFAWQHPNEKNESDYNHGNYDFIRRITSLSADSYPRAIRVSNNGFLSGG